MGEWRTAQNRDNQGVMLKADPAPRPRRPHLLDSRGLQPIRPQSCCSGAEGAVTHTGIQKRSTKGPPSTTSVQSPVSPTNSDPKIFECVCFCVFVCLLFCFLVFVFSPFFFSFFLHTNNFSPLILFYIFLFLLLSIFILFFSSFHVTYPTYILIYPLLLFLNSLLLLHLFSISVSFFIIY